MKNTRLTLVQMRSVVGNPQSNYDSIEGFVRANKDSDIVCFPEMCLSGYTSTDPARYAMDPNDPLLDRIRDLSKETDTAIVFGYIERMPDGLCLRQEICYGDESFFYRKSHLGIKEADLFTPGDSLPVFEIKGIMLGIHLCTESHIPDICSTFRKQGAELVLIPFANGISSERRRQVWHSYLPARACDNGMFVAGCSAVGDNGTGTVFGGGLIALDPKGMVIDEYYGDDNHSITVEIGGPLPRDGPETMMNISYFDRKRPELYR